MEDIQSIMASDIRKLKRAENEIQLNTRELLWAEIFHDTIAGSKWMKDKRLKLGRAAIGYNLAYVLYRILDEIQPENILEIGLGESTQIIYQYMKRGKRRGKHICVEQNAEWIEFWKKSHRLSSKSCICCLPVDKSSYNECENVLVYQGFERFKNHKWNLILVDGPLQTDCDSYRRIDTLKILPDCLSEQWIIIFDDFNRQPDKNTVNAVSELLKKNDIEYCEGIYKGKKDVCVLCSTNLYYVTTM